MRERLKILEAEVVELEYALSKNASKITYSAGATKSWHEAKHQLNKLENEIAQIRRKLTANI